MKGFRKLVLAVIICMILIAVIANLIIMQNNKGDEGRPYRVEALRIAYEIEQGREPDLSKYKYITAVRVSDPTDDNAGFFDSDNDYLIKQIKGKIYRIEYDYSDDDGSGKAAVIMNSILAGIYLVVLVFMLYIRNRIIRPFDSMKKLPLELAKGNVTAPIEAEKNSYFGDFIWSLNLLKDKLEKGRQQDLELRKNEKSLILSISHDIKTPIGIIELNAKALERGLYDNDSEKKNRITGVIKEKCEEITAYVDQIIKASREDFLEAEVKNGEFYLSEIADNIRKVYSGKMELLKIGFKVDDCPDCLLKGDPDRAVEVVQNLLENAIKYGDGKEISVVFNREENSQLISVSNTGCTLEDTELPHIFDSFWRGANTGSNPGSGLGLYICKQLMNRMNGDIFAEIHDGRMTVTAVFGMA